MLPEFASWVEVCEMRGGGDLARGCSSLDELSSLELCGGGEEGSESVTLLATIYGLVLRRRLVRLTDGGNKCTAGDGGPAIVLGERVRGPTISGVGEEFWDLLVGGGGVTGVV